MLSDLLYSLKTVSCDMESQSPWSKDCLEDTVTFVTNHLTANARDYPGPFNVGGLWEILCKVIRDEGVLGAEPTSETWSLHFKEELFPSISEQNKLVYTNVWDTGLLSEILYWLKPKNTPCLGDLLGYWQPGHSATVLQLVEIDCISCILNW